MITREDVKKIGKKKAIELFESNWWELCSHEEIAKFQLLIAELCCPFDVFQEAVEKAAGRPVFTHEFGLNYDGILNEVFNGSDAPTFQEIVDLIPAEKRVILAVGEK